MFDVLRPVTENPEKPELLVVQPVRIDFGDGPRLAAAKKTHPAALPDDRDRRLPSLRFADRFNHGVGPRRPRSGGESPPANGQAAYIDGF